MPFLKANDIILDIPKDTIHLGKQIIRYNTSRHSTSSHVRRSQSYLQRSTQKSIVHPGEFLEVRSPHGLNDVEVALEPRSDTPNFAWPEPIITVNSWLHQKSKHLICTYCCDQALIGILHKYGSLKNLLPRSYPMTHLLHMGGIDLLKVILQVSALTLTINYHNLNVRCSMIFTANTRRCSNLT